MKAVRKRSLHSRAAQAAFHGKCKLAVKLMRKAKRSKVVPSAYAVSVVEGYCPSANLGSARSRKRKRR